jgi:ATP-dependent Clp protease ATP-binding subunit ClpA
MELRYRNPVMSVRRWRPAKSHKEQLKLSFLLFDEIEKSSDALWQLLLGMLDKATLTLGGNRRVDLSQTIIFLTSNLGGGEITEMMGGGMGFIQPKDKPVTDLNQKLEAYSGGSGAAQPLHRSL